MPTPEKVSPVPKNANTVKTADDDGSHSSPGGLFDCGQESPKSALGFGDGNDSDFGDDHAYKYPPPPTSDHPNINNILKSAAKAVCNKLV